MHAALATALLVGPAWSGQGAAQAKPDKLHKYVRDACGKNPMIRIQASRRVIRYGAAAVAAVRAFIAEHGKQELSGELVEAIGRIHDKSGKELLRELFGDPLFFWRAQALRGLAFAPTAEDRELFPKSMSEASWLVRRAALSGSAKANDANTRIELLTGLCDKDLRVQVSAAGLLLERSEYDGLVLLLVCLDMQDSFFGDDFGARLRNDAFRYLRRAAKNDFDYRARAKYADRSKGVERFLAWAKPHLTTALQRVPEFVERKYVLGFERRSCQLGDVYLRIDERGRLWRGLFSPERAELAPEVLAELRRLSREVPPTLAKVHGRLRCEVERFAGLGKDSKFSIRCARGSIPKQLAALSAAWHKVFAAK